MSSERVMPLIQWILHDITSQALRGVLATLDTTAQGPQDYISLARIPGLEAQFHLGG